MQASSGSGPQGARAGPTTDLSLPGTLCLRAAAEQPPGPGSRFRLLLRGPGLGQLPGAHGAALAHLEVRVGAERAAASGAGPDARLATPAGGLGFSLGFDSALLADLMGATLVGLVALAVGDEAVEVGQDDIKGLPPTNSCGPTGDSAVGGHESRPIPPIRSYPAGGIR
ncbi:hypothetical protein GCM10010358_83310 [Streptomyces minutiscleroticus]|uniref:Uncharacterized protein n=1 Tax=Streptomyces minutiscleroticus TaxID=68238 RepID=A0A918P530_9ACTN|nr:hypothetical protein GCM10010358_83310 [Streptomyces minutiscleroticus]